MYTHERNFGCRISDEWTYRGLRVLVMENDLLRISILLDKGTDIFEFLYKPRDLDLMWKSPIGVRPQPWLDSAADPNGPFLDYQEGGWQEVLPNGGRVTNYEGANLALHSEVWSLPWKHQIIDDGPECVTVKLWVRCIRTPFLLEKTLSLQRGEAGLEISETVTNEGEVEMPLMWGHHPSFSARFANEDAVIRMPECEVVCDPSVDDASRFGPLERFPWSVGRGRDGDAVDVSQVPARGSGISDMLYLTELSEGWAEIHNRRLDTTFRMDFDVETFRHCWLYMEYGGNKGFWAWGRNNSMALEPFSSWPAMLHNAVENGTELRLPPRGRRQTWLRASVLGE